MHGRTLRTLALTGACLLLLAVASAPASAQAGACAQTGGETVATDRPSYSNLEVVHVTGSGYAADCSVVVKVTRPDGSVVTGDGTETPGSDVVATGPDGSLSYDYMLGTIDGDYVVEVISEGVVLASVTFADSADLQRLRVGSAAGSENYIFTAGNTIYAQGTIDGNRWYRFVVRDPSGTVKQTSLCTASGTSTTNVDNTYAVGAADPTSGSSVWEYRLEQSSSQTNCAAGTTSSTDTLQFWVAKATVYGDSALTQLKTNFNASPAYVRVAGLGADGPNQTESDWQTTWLLPNGTTTACANTSGGDRPDSAAGGGLPSTASQFLQYLPNSTATGDNWNRLANYETKPGAGSTCLDFAGNDGQWYLKLQADNTHFVTLPVFVVDNTAPTSSASSPTYSNSNSFTVTYTASDSSGVASVELFVDPPGGAATFVSAGVDNTPASPSFNYTAVDGNGTYRFYTRATDSAGNVEAAPSTEDDTTVVDTVAPSTSDDVDTNWHTSAVTVTLTSTDGTSGVDKIYFTTDGTTPTTSSSVYDASNKPTLNNGEAIKYFAVDNAGNTETVKTSNAAKVDGDAPSTTDDVDANWHQTAVVVTLTSDDGTGGSGVDKIYYTTDGTTPTTSSSVYDASNKPTLGNGEAIKYFAVDVAGNAETVKTSNAAKVDGDTPSTTDDVDTNWHTSAVTVTLTSDDGPGASGVDKIYYTTDGTTPTTSSSVYDASNKPTLGNGEAIKYFAVDVAGNAETVKTSNTAKVDGDTPSTTDDVDANWHASSVTVTLTADDSSGSGIAAIYYTTDGTTPTTSSSVYDASNKPTLNNGEAIKYFAVDNAGNTETVKTSNAAKVDGTAPTTTDDVDTNWHQSAVTVTLTSNDNVGGSGVDKIYYTTDGTTPSVGSSVYDASNKPTLGNGEAIKYRAVDVAGNMEAVKTSNPAKVDGNAPTTTDDVDTNWHQSNVTVTLTSNDSGPSGVDKIYYTTDGTTPTTSSSVYDASNKPTLGNGETIKYFAVDVAGNTETVKTSNTAKVDGAAPSSSASAPATSSTTSISVSYTASDSGASGLDDVELWAKGPSDASYAKVDTDTTPSASGESFAYTASQGDGTYRFYTRAHDEAGNYEAAPSTADATTTVTTTTAFNFTGFLSPVDNLPTLNSVKAGQSVPVKFKLGGNQGLNIFATGYPASQTIPCDSTAEVDAVEATMTAGNSTLTYDAATDTYTYVWKTNKAWASTCRQLVIKLSDNTYHRANFKLK